MIRYFIFKSNMTDKWYVGQYGGEKEHVDYIIKYSLLNFEAACTWLKGYLAQSNN